ncbi:MAG: VanZ family protein, partial [Gemmatimonadales bacterium]
MLLWAAAVAFATLQPNRSPGVEPTFACLICGERGWADALLNVIMFLPLGALLALRATPPRYAALVAFLLSTLIEGAQLMIPGRDPSLGDILFNTVGGLCGYAIAGTIVRQLRVDRGWPPFVTAAGALGIIGATGYLLEPVLPNT